MKKTNSLTVNIEELEEIEPITENQNKTESQTSSKL